MLLNIRQLMDDAKCYEVVRELRWPDGVKCPACDSGQINKRGFHDHQTHRQRYSCQECGRQFDDLSGTVFVRASAWLKNVDTVSVFDGVKPI